MGRGTKKVENHCISATFRNFTTSLQMSGSKSKKLLILCSITQT